VLAVGLTGIGQYVTLAVMTLFSRGDLFTVAPSAQTWEFVPHLVIASVVWYVGLLVLTIVLMVLVNRTLQRAKAQPGPASSTAQPPVNVWQNR
jgi:beta-lactamase regulating signal transducer with metallopeptidase domain